MLKVKFINIVTVGAIALATATAAPARADSDGEKIIKLLIGVAAVAAIANSAKKNDDRHTNQRIKHTPPKRVKHHTRPPKTCLRKRYTGHGWKTFYSRKCLNKHHYRHNDRHVYNDVRPHNNHDHDRRRKHTPIY